MSWMPPQPGWLGQLIDEHDYQKRRSAACDRIKRLSRQLNVRASTIREAMKNPKKLRSVRKWVRAANVKFEQR